MRALLASILVLLLASPAVSGDRPHAGADETAWSAWIAEWMGGEAEHRTPSGARVDVLTDGTAWEVDWCQSGKVFEAVGQALYYRAATNRDGGVVLLMGRRPFKQEIIHYERCLTACREAGLKLLVVNVAKP